MDWGRVLFDPNGRIGKQTYWIGVLIIFLGNIILPAIPLIGTFAWFALIWVGVAIYGKRLHDTGRTAWVHAIPWVVTSVLTALGFILFGASLIPVIADALNEVEPDAFSIGSVLAGVGGLALFGLIGAVVWIGYTIWLGVLDSDPRGEVYGPSLD